MRTHAACLVNPVHQGDLASSVVSCLDLMYIPVLALHLFTVSSQSFSALAKPRESTGNFAGLRVLCKVAASLLVVLVDLVDRGLGVARQVLLVALGRYPTVRLRIAFQLALVALVDLLNQELGRPRLLPRERPRVRRGWPLFLIHGNGHRSGAPRGRRQLGSS